MYNIDRMFVLYIRDQYTYYVTHFMQEGDSVERYAVILSGRGV